MRRMTRTATAVTTAMAVVALLAGAASASVGAAKSKEVSAEKYAKAVCGAYNSTNSGYEDLSSGYQALPVDDPATFQSDAAALADEFVATIEQQIAKLKKIYPDAEDGKKVGKLFVADLQTYIDKVEEATTKFRAADASGVAFQGDVIQFETALQILDVGASDPFREVDDQDLIGAFDDEKSCAEVVQVFGG